MLFKNFIESVTSIAANPGPSMDPKTITIYPISEYNLEGLKILFDTSMRMGGGGNINVEVATVSPSLWMGDFLDKHWDKISYVTTTPNFSIIKIRSNEMVSCSYRTDTISFDSDEELDTFFNDGKWKKFVLFSINKYVDLRTLKSSYIVRYADITEKFEIRDNKINSILDTDPK